MSLGRVYTHTVDVLRPPNQRMLNCCKWGGQRLIGRFGNPDGWRCQQSSGSSLRLNIALNESNSDGIQLFDDSQRVKRCATDLWSSQHSNISRLKPFSVGRPAKSHRSCSVVALSAYSQVSVKGTRFEPLANDCLAPPDPGFGVGHKRGHRGRLRATQNRPGRYRGRTARL